MPKKNSILSKRSIKSINNLGHLFFGLGLALVFLFTITNSPNMLLPSQGILLLITGLIVGLVEIKKEDTIPLQLSFLGLLVISNAPLEVIGYNIGMYLKFFLINLSLFLSLAVAVASVRTIYRIYKDSKV